MAALTTDDIEKRGQGPLHVKVAKGKYASSAIKGKCAAVLESNLATSFMTLITIYALFSDDVRVLTVDASHDDVFTVFSSMAFFLFLLEIGVQCWCKEKYMRLPDLDKMKSMRDAITWKERLHILRRALFMGSFYFWLDLLATMSMIFEIPWMSPSSFDDGANSNLENARAGKASRAGAKAARILKVVRMIRLVRLVKLYKYFADNKQKKEGSIAPDDDDAIENMPPESHVGAEMSDRTTKKVIVGILVMLIVIPLLQVDELEYLNEFGMQMVFERRASLLGLPRENSTDDMLIQDATESWKLSEDYFLNSTKCIKLEYSGFLDAEGSVARIPAGRSDPTVLREQEKATLKIAGESNDLTMTATFDTSARADEEAILGILLTTFVIILLAVGTMTFSRDVNSLVIIPIEKMVQLVREISANPLGKNFSLEPEEMKEMDDGMETTLLLRTISKIAGLMRVGFGEAGAEIIGKNLNMSNDDNGGSSMNLLGNGTKIQSIFGFCDVRNFTDTTECLQEEVMLFVNRIAHILHSIVVQCDGAANKNIGDAFLLTWKLNPSQLSSCEEHDYAADKALYSLLKTMVEMNRYEDFICNFSPTALGALYERMPGYKCRIGCGLHFGWAVEGAIGSDKKIDASYISPHVNWSEFLEGSTKEYGVPILLSQPFFDLLSPKVKKYCRQVDNIKKSATDKAIALYTYDADLDVEFYKPTSDTKRSTYFSAKSQRTSREKNFIRSSNASGSTTVLDSDTSLRSSGAFSRAPKFPGVVKAKTNKVTSGVLDGAPDIVLPPFSVDVWDGDDDMVRLRMHFSDDHRQIWNEAMSSFLAGDWNVAVTQFTKVLEMTSGNDGPARYMLNRISLHGNQVPDDWHGYWQL